MPTLSVSGDISSSEFQTMRLVAEVRFSAAHTLRSVARL
jgi:hypothetical protein